MFHPGLSAETSTTPGVVAAPLNRTFTVPGFEGIISRLNGVACAETMRKPPGIGAPGCGLGTTAGGLLSVGSIPSQPLKTSNDVVVKDSKERATFEGFIAAEFALTPPSQASLR